MASVLKRFKTYGKQAGDMVKGERFRGFRAAPAATQEQEERQVMIANVSALVNELKARAETGKPVTIGLAGAGQMGTDIVVQLCPHAGFAAWRHLGSECGPCD